MGLFINSHLQTLNVHKRLTELEKLSEISTGILALKSMVETGDKLQDRQSALENLSRIMPMLSSTQQKFVMDEIFTPLWSDSDLFSNTEDPLDSELNVSDSIEGDGAVSDYEMEFQLKLNKANFLDIKALNREQLEFRRKNEVQRLKEEKATIYEQERTEGFHKINTLIESDWQKLNDESKSSPKRIKRDLKRFLFRFGSSLGKDHDLVTEARRRLKAIG